MAATFSTPELQVASSTAITRTEFQVFLDNLRRWYTPSAYRLYATVEGQSTSGSLAALDFAPSGNFHSEWLYEGGDGSTADTTYHGGTGGLYVNVGDVAEGIWLNGVMASIENPPDAGDVFSSVTASESRRVQLRRGDGATFT